MGNERSPLRPAGKGLVPRSVSSLKVPERPAAQKPAAATSPEPELPRASQPSSGVKRTDPARPQATNATPLEPRSVQRPVPKPALDSRALLNALGKPAAQRPAGSASVKRSAPTAGAKPLAAASSTTRAAPPKPAPTEPVPPTPAEPARTAKAPAPEKPSDPKHAPAPSANKPSDPKHAPAPSANKPSEPKRAPAPAPDPKHAPALSANKPSEPKRAPAPAPDKPSELESRTAPTKGKPSEPKRTVLAAPSKPLAVAKPAEPQRAPAPAAPEPQRRPAPQAPPALEPTLLLVGADDKFAPALRLALARHRIYVETAELADVANTVVVTAPDLVLLVGEAARDGGAAVLEKLAGSPATSVVPVAILDDNTALDVRLRAFRHGAVAVIQRTASIDAIANEVARLAREIPERGGESLGVVGEATLNEFLNALGKELRSGILSLKTESGDEPVRLVLGNGRPLAELIDDFVKRAKGHVVKAEPLEYEFDGRAGGTIQLLGAESEAAPGAIGGLRVALADDDPARADVVAQELRARGATVVVVDLQPSEHQFSRLRQIDPEVLLIGEQHVQGTGYSLIRKMRRDTRLRWASLLVVRWDEVWSERVTVPAIDRLTFALRSLTEGDRTLRERVDTGEAFDTRLEITGPARCLRALASSSHSLRVTVFNPRVRVTIDLSEGLVAGASAEPVESEASPRESWDGTHALAALLVLSSGRVRVEPVQQPATTNVMATIDVALSLADQEAPPIAPSVPAPQGSSYPPPRDEVPTARLGAAPVIAIEKSEAAGGTSGAPVSTTSPFVPVSVTPPVAYPPPAPSAAAPSSFRPVQPTIPGGVEAPLPPPVDPLAATTFRPMQPTIPGGIEAPSPSSTAPSPAVDPFAATAFRPMQPTIPGGIEAPPPPITLPGPVDPLAATAWGPPVARAPAPVPPAASLAPAYGAPSPAPPAGASLPPSHAAPAPSAVPQHLSAPSPVSPSSPTAFSRSTKTLVGAAEEAVGVRRKGISPQLALFLVGMAALQGALLAVGYWWLTKDNAAEAKTEAGEAVAQNDRESDAPTNENAPSAAPPRASGKASGPSNPALVFDAALSGADRVTGVDESGYRAPSCEELFVGQRVPYGDFPGAAYEQQRLAERAIVRGEVHEAHLAYCKAVRWDKRSVGRYIDLAQFMLIRRDGARAADWARRALEVQPGNTRAYNLLGDGLARIGDVKGAEQAWFIALGTNAPTQAEREEFVQKAMREATLSTAKRDYTRAERFYRRAIIVDPNHFKAALGLATCLLKLGEPKPALRWAERALALEPRSAAAHVLVGDAYLADGDSKRAESKWREALNVDPQYGEALLRLNKLTSKTP